MVSATPELAASIERSIPRLSAGSIEDRALLLEVVGVEPERVVGPAFQGFVTSDLFRRPQSSAEHHTSDLETVVSELKPRCREGDWDASGLAKTTGSLAVAVSQSEVVGAAGLRERTVGVVDPCVLIRADQRGLGLGRDLVGQVTEAALTRGDLVLYQTLMSNSAAVTIARALGFEQYATSVAMRLR